MNTVSASARLQLSSVLPAAFRPELEQLLFFNPGQERLRKGIQESIARHGVPQIVADQTTLRVQVGELGVVQAVFAIAELPDRASLVGAVLYHRASTEEIVVLHIAVDQHFTAAGNSSDTLLVMRLVDSLRQSARCIKGIRWITVYAERGPLRLIVRHPTSN